MYFGLLYHWIVEIVNKSYTIIYFLYKIISLLYKMWNYENRKDGTKKEKSSIVHQDLRSLLKAVSCMLEENFIKNICSQGISSYLEIRFRLLKIKLENPWTTLCFFPALIWNNNMYSQPCPLLDTEYILHQSDFKLQPFTHKWASIHPNQCSRS